MTCLPELTYAVYVDGELPPAEVRPLESHLVQCRACRELVVALREEAELLGDVLLERSRAPRRASAAPAAARGLALGIGPTLAVGAAATLAVGWILEALAPAVQRWLGPIASGGVTNMAFDLIFLLRDEAPGLLEVGLAVAAMATASALLTFALTALLRHWSGPGLLTLTALLGLALPAPEAHAHFGMHEHEDYTLPADETHDGTLVISVDDANIDGVVEGDLLVLGRRVTIRGEVRGNVMALAASFELSGRVRGSVHVIGASAHLTGEVDGNLYAFAEELGLRPGARVGRDAAVAADSAVLEGSVGRDLVVTGERIDIRGPVARNVHAWADELDLLDGARVGGDVRAVLPRDNEVEISSGAVVAGEIRSEPFVHRHERGFSRYLEARFWLWIAIHIGAAFLVGMLAHVLLPAVFGGRLETPAAFFRALGVGFLVVVAGPVALALVAVTLVGIPLALMGAALLVSSAYLGLIAVAVLLGSALVHPRGDGRTAFGLALLTGLAILALATHAPFLGPVVWVVAVLAGLGLLTERARDAFLDARRAR